MQKPKNKTIPIAIAIFLMLSMSASMMLVPTSSAHTPAWHLTTFAYIQAFPNPIGVGQTTLIYIWLDKTMDGESAANDIRFHNYNLTITAADGTTETHIFATVQDTTSSQGYSFTPDQTGNYTLTFTFPGQAINTYSHANDDYVNDTYLPSSASTTLTVQEEPVANYPSSYPLPTEYWTRPIYGENTDWWSISSNWLGSGAPGYGGFTAIANPATDTVGPQTSHVMWTKPYQSGGVVGGDKFTIQGDTYMEGSAYVIRYINPIIMNGKLYYTETLSVTGNPGLVSTSYGPTDCVNLQTGKLIWSRTDVPALSFGYIYNMQNMNYHGVWPPILISTGGGMMSMGTWQGYDADTGNWLFNVTNVPSGTKVLGPSGEHLIYVLTNKGTPTNPNYYLAEWNSSKVGYGLGALRSTGAISGVVDGSAASNYDWNVSIPSMTSAPTVVGAFYDDVMICYNGSLPSGGGSGPSGSAPTTAPYTYFAIQLNATKGTIGSVLWWNTLSAPSGNITVQKGPADPTSGVFTEGYKETMQFVGYSMSTGQKLWGPTESQSALDYYDEEGATMCAYGKLYSCGQGGIIYCNDLKTGNLLWTYGNGGSGNSTNSGFQVPGPYPINIYAIGNGIVYTMTSEHTVQTPIYKGALARAINATDGTEIWTLSNDNNHASAAIADGYANFFNGYDNQIYTVGRGPSATTVTAPDTGLSFGTPVVIKGSVTDISSGTTQDQQAADFPNGVACASDASMSEWMGYVYQQKPLPTNFTGVPVSIDVLDSNGNYRNIGTATTDASGTYRLTWTPDIPGNYTVIATFAGTNGYWGSYAEDGFNVMEAAAATAAPTATPASMADQYFLPLSIGMIIAIVIVVALLALALLMLRKRP